jgi:hypothetical protein
VQRDLELRLALRQVMQDPGDDGGIGRELVFLTAGTSSSTAMSAKLSDDSTSTVRMTRCATAPMLGIAMRGWLPLALSARLEPAADQDRDDGDHDQQLDQGESARAKLGADIHGASDERLKRSAPKCDLCQRAALCER